MLARVRRGQRLLLTVIFTVPVVATLGQPGSLETASTLRFQDVLPKPGRFLALPQTKVSVARPLLPVFGNIDIGVGRPLASAEVTVV